MTLLKGRKNEKILLTGGTGFIGRNILPILRQEYDVDAPGRQLLNVYEKQSVDKWLCEHSADFLVHCAIATPANPLDNNQNILESTLRSFAHFKNHEHQFEKSFISVRGRNTASKMIYPTFRKTISAGFCLLTNTDCRNIF